jgi:steroid delta-isomerase-like uncharacterized protein
MSPAAGTPLRESQLDGAERIMEPAPLVSPAGPVAPGETVEVTVSLVNEDEHPAQIEFFGTDLVSLDGARIQADNLAFQPRVLMLEAGKSDDIKVQVAVPAHTMAGTYSGLIRASKLDYLHAVLIVQVERAVDVPRDDIRDEIAMATISGARQAARITLVEEHVRVENTGDIEATLRTFGKHPHCVVNGVNLYGHHSIRGFYQSFFRGFPDLKVNVTQRHVSEDAIILEVTLTGTHLGTFNGIPPSGRGVEIPLCAIFKFDENERILGEWVYFDNWLVMEQLGQRPGGSPQR